jgi:hypothetical protein
MDDIINTLTRNVGSNDTLIDQVLGLITELKAQKAEQAQLGNSAGLKIASLEAELDAYRQRVEEANARLEKSIGKMKAEIGLRPAPPAPPVLSDGKRRSRKRNSRKKKSKRSKKSSKKRHY